MILTNLNTKLMLTVLQLLNGYMEMNRDMDVVNMSDVMNECECEMMIM